MIRLAALFFIIALVAWMFGFGGIAAFSASMGKTVLGVFLVLVVLGMLFFGGVFRRA